MQVLSKKSANNFYETFSDLLFCTLVLFIMLFLMLAAAMEKRVEAVIEATEDPQKLIEQVQAERDRAQKLQTELDSLMATIGDDPDVEKLKESLAKQAADVEGLKNELKQLVGSNRFTGRSGLTFVNFATDHSGTERRHWFLPQPLSEKMSVSIHKETAAEAAARKKLCRLEFAALVRASEGFTDKQVSSIVANGSTLYQVSDEKPVRMHLQTSGQFSVFATGVVDLDGEITAKGALIYKITDEAFDGLNEDNAFTAPLTEITGTIPSLIFFPHEDRTLTIGGVNVNIFDARGIILAIGGRGAAVEFRPSTPDWVVDEILKPTGYVNRVPKMTADDDASVVEQ